MKPLTKLEPYSYDPFFSQNKLHKSLPIILALAYEYADC